MNTSREDQRGGRGQQGEQARASDKPSDQKAAAKNWSRQNEQQRPAVQKDETRTVQQSKDKAGASESEASQATFPQRTKPPGQAGLANEARPGLGTRADEDRDPAAGEPVVDNPNEPPRADPKAYQPPRPEPREQAPDSLAHQQERSTSVSGHTSSD